MLGWNVVPRIGFGSFTISPHGVGIAFGVFVGAWLMARRARARGYDENHAWNGAAWGVVGAIFGARIAYVAGHLEQFESPAEWLRIWEGGISLVGGLIGAFVLVYVYVRRNRLSFFELVDLGAPGLGIGIALGRIGDLLIGDHLGRETSGWWGWQYKGGELISPPPCATPAGGPVYGSADGCIAPGMFVHQTALYDALWSLAIFGILLYLDRRPSKRGFLYLSWASLYAAGRIATDFLRVDKTWFGIGLTGSQLTSIAVLLVCLFLLIRYRGVPVRVPAPSPPEAVPASAAAAVEAGSDLFAAEVEPLPPPLDLFAPEPTADVPAPPPDLFAPNATPEQESPAQATRMEPDPGEEETGVPPDAVPPEPTPGDDAGGGTGKATGEAPPPPNND